jgi:hypothetical protein
MAIDWDQFDSDLDTAIVDAGDRTDAKLSSRVSSITRMTDEEIEELFPNPADVKELGRLMRIVKESGNRNEKISKIVDDANSFGGVIFNILEKFA